MATFNISKKKDLIKLKKAIQQKNFDKKDYDIEIERDFAKLYKPVIEPLKEIVKETAETKKTLKEIPAIKPTISAIGAPETKPQEIPAIEAPTQETKNINLGSIATKYLQTVFVKDYDHAYGIKPIEGSDRFKLGEKELKIDGDDIVVYHDNKSPEKFKGTEGLWQLLTLKEPEKYSENDIEHYEQIMYVTKPFFRVDGNPKSTRGHKWSTIMKPIYEKYVKNITSKRVGSIKDLREQQKRRRSTSDPYSSDSDSNIRNMHSKTREDKRRRFVIDSSDSDSNIRNIHSKTGEGLNNIIILPSDINELIERHKLLFRQLNSGNNGVFNEINAINDKLLEKGILDKEDIERFLKIFT